MIESQFGNLHIVGNGISFSNNEMVASDLRKWFDWNLKESTISKGKRHFIISLVIKFKQQRTAIYLYLRIRPF